MYITILELARLFDFQIILERFTRLTGITLFRDLLRHVFMSPLFTFQVYVADSLYENKFNIPKVGYRSTSTELLS